jgi:hypothetical protein
LVTKLELINRVRSHTRDFNASSFRTDDIVGYINEAIDRLKQLIKQLDGMVHLASNNDEPILLPLAYHHLLAVYAAARCFAQDDRNYQASTLMNEFEVKADELLQKIINGEITIVNEEGTAVDEAYNIEYIDLETYWGKKNTNDHFIDYVYI